MTEINILRIALFNKWGIKTTIHNKNMKNGVYTQWRIYINKSGLLILQPLLLPHILSMYEYKLLG